MNFNKLAFAAGSVWLAVVLMVNRETKKQKRENER